MVAAKGGNLGIGHPAGQQPEQPLGAVTAPLRLFRRNEPLALMPHVFVQ